jgi:DNA-binding winged helix-turn-helix (wHTH) protein
MESRLKNAYQFGPFLLDPDAHVLLRDGRSIPLPPKAYDTLLALVQRRGALLTKDELLNLVWPGSFVEENNLQQHISLLRKALGENGDGSPEYIETLPRRGYRFIANVAPVQGASLGSQTADAVALVDTPRGRRRVWWVIAALGLASAAITVLALAFRAPQLPKVTRYVQLTNDGKPKARPVSFLNILVTDGSRIYFAGGAPRGWQVEEIPVARGEAVTLPVSFEGVVLNDISRDHSRLLVAARAKGTEPNSAYWVVSLPGGPAERLGDVSAAGASWTPDGKLLAYAKDQSLFTANADGGEPRMLATFGGTPFQPRWSPDGKLLRLFLAMVALPKN